MARYITKRALFAPDEDTPAVTRGAVLDVREEFTDEDGVRCGDAYTASGRRLSIPMSYLRRAPADGTPPPSEGLLVKTAEVEKGPAFYGILSGYRPENWADYDDS